MLVVVVCTEVMGDILLGIVTGYMSYGMAREGLDRCEEFFDIECGEGAGRVEGGKQLAASFIDKGDHVPVVIEGERGDGATHVGVKVCARGCGAWVTMEWRAGFLSHEAARACEARRGDFKEGGRPGARLCMAIW